jgi:hypothetical protein
LVIGAVWMLLAVWHPTTTYHLGPALVAAAWPLTLRRRDRNGRAPWQAVVLSVLGGAAVVVAVIALLAARGAMAGPTLFGGHGAVVEALLTTAVGAAFGGWRAMRRRPKRTRG